MARLEFDMETTLPPDKVIAMLLDFSEHRPETWPFLSARVYEAYSIDDKTAEIREGATRPNIWNRERYDWSTPGRVRWEVVESNFCKPGSFVDLQAERTERGGSRLHVIWDRRPMTLKGRFVISLHALTRGAIARASLNAAFKKAEEEAVATSS